MTNMKTAARLAVIGIAMSGAFFSSAQAQQTNAPSKATTATERGVRVTRGPAIVRDAALEKSLAGANRSGAAQNVVINVRRGVRRPPGLVVKGFRGRTWRINGSHGIYPNRVFGIVPR